MSSQPPYSVMGIINVTPDSFSDGGSFHDPGAAVAQARSLIAQGADILDIGGESTRPYAEPVTETEELHRTIPVIREIRSFSAIPISIDTTKAAVAREALAAGATMINDVSALRQDPEMLDVVKASEAELVIMHMQGTPGTMQDNPVYDEVVGEIGDFFQERLSMLKQAGVNLQRVIVDPGIGFGKTLAHNLSILKHLNRLAACGQRLMLGHSRKRFLGEITGGEPAERDFATAVTAALSLQHRVAIFRVHQVALTRQALMLASAILSAR